jgi:hypothetical protein
METLAEFDGKEKFYSSLASALDDGLKLSEDDLAFAPWERYVKEPRFRELLNISPQQQGND